jgi:hypothetical protein
MTKTCFFSFAILLFVACQSPAAKPEEEAIRHSADTGLVKPGPAPRIKSAQFSMKINGAAWVADTAWGSVNRSSILNLGAEKGRENIFLSVPYVNEPGTFLIGKGHDTADVFFMLRGGKTYDGGGGRGWMKITLTELAKYMSIGSFEGVLFHGKDSIIIRDGKFDIRR